MRWMRKSYEDADHQMSGRECASWDERVAAVLLLREDGAMLFRLRDEKAGLRDAGRWVLPGGHCRPGEPIETCAAREFLEETGYICGPLTWLTTFRIAGDATGPACLATIFLDQYDGTQPLHCLEGQRVQFIERPQAAAYPIVSYLLGIWELGMVAQQNAAVNGKAEP